MADAPPPDRDIRSAPLADLIVRISDQLDDAGLTPHEQVAALCGLVALALAAMPAEERRLATEAHIEALGAVKSDNRLVRQ